MSFQKPINQSISPVLKLTSALVLTSFQCQVIDENDPPTAVDLNSSGIPETAPIGTVIGILSTVDEDVGQTHTYKVLNFNNITNGCKSIDIGSVLRLFCNLYVGTYFQNSLWNFVILEQKNLQ